MLYLVLAVGFIAFVITVLRHLQGPNPLYITAYALVFMSGLVGQAILVASIPLWKNSLGLGIIMSVIGVTYLAVTIWGVIILKRHHFT